MQTEMKINDALFLLTLVVFVSGCSSVDQSKEGLPCIDVRKKYPEKEIILTDIADVEYVHLSTAYDEYLYKGFIGDITENTIVVGDDSSGSVLFFSRDGKPKSRFNRKGAGPEEYPAFLKPSIVYDETADDVYILINNGRNIFVYSSTGKYKRKLPLSADVSSLVDFDDHSLFVYDTQLIEKRQMKEGYTSSQALDSSFMRISKEDGRVLDFALIPYSDVDLTFRSRSETFFNAGIWNFNRIRKGTSGVYLCNPESDTIFHYSKDKTITPVICKTPLASNLDPKIVFYGFTDIGRYQFMSDFTIVNPLKRRDNYPNSNHYGYDKHTGEIFSPKIILPDYKGKYFFLSNTVVVGEKMLVYINMNLYSLKQAYKENRLNGQLKALVATLNEDFDNEVYVFATIK